VKRTPLLVFAAALALLAMAPVAAAGVIVGTAGDDTLAGTDRRDFVYGRAGNDTIARNGASDFLFGQRGDDTVSGDAGRDVLWGGSGNDTLEGGGGPDALYGGRGLDVLEGGHDGDFLHSAEKDGLPDIVDGGAGRDRAVIRVGDVAVDCEPVRVLPARRSRVVFQRGTREGVDTIDGNNGPDRLWGGSEGDLLHGGTGRTGSGAAEVPTSCSARKGTTVSTPPPTT
jgi:Ca2+-binding RTX toxin-like protein